MQVRWRGAREPWAHGELPYGMGRVMGVVCHDLNAGRTSPPCQALTQALTQDRIPSLSFDFDGARAPTAGATYSQQMEELDAAIDFVCARGTQQVVLFGAGMGGAVALLTAARDERVAAVATLGAMGRPAQLLAHGPYLRAHLQGASLAAFTADSLAHDVVAAVRVLRAPVLVVHGEDDALVPSYEAHDIACAAKHASLELVPGADHSFSRPEHLRPAMQRIARFMASHVVRALVQRPPPQA